MESGPKTSLNPFDDLEDEVEESGTQYDKTQDDGPCEAKEHWDAMEDAMSSMLTNPFALEELRQHMAAIAQLVIREKPAVSGRTGANLEFILSENVVESFYLFSTRQKVYGKQTRVLLLKFFSDLFTRSEQPILIHQQILRPLSRLIRSCEDATGTEGDEVAVCLVPLLHRICILIQENNSLLELFFVNSAVHKQSKFLVFTQLIPHMHAMGEVGMMARDAVLLCLSLAAQLSSSNLGRFVATDCSFCQVLATGLSALYSELPSSVEVTVDEWQSPLPVIESSVPQLRKFTQSLDFCNSILQVAPKVVCDIILSLVREGFLQQVLGPALLQSSEEAQVFSTAYLAVFLSHISNACLMREFLKYVVLGRCDGRSLLDALVLNMNSSNDMLCAVTLELFHALVDLNCEDLMLQLILRYLLPGRHVMPNQIPIIGVPDMYSSGARKLLCLVPSACTNSEKLFLESLTGGPGQGAAASSPDSSRAGSPPLLQFTSQPVIAAGNHHLLERPLSTPLVASPMKYSVGGALGSSPGSSVMAAAPNPFDLLPVTRSRSGSNTSTCSSMTNTSVSSVSGNPPPLSTCNAASAGSGGGGNSNNNDGAAIVSMVTASVGAAAAHHHGDAIAIATAAAAAAAASSSEQVTSSTIIAAMSEKIFDVVSPEDSYHVNLCEAREAIGRCAARCSCWSSTYDQCQVPSGSSSATGDFQQEKKTHDSSSTEIVSCDDDGGGGSRRSVHNGTETVQQESRFRSRAATMSHMTRPAARKRNRDRLQVPSPPQWLKEPEGGGGEQEGERERGETTTWNDVGSGVLGASDDSGWRTGSVSTSPRTSPGSARRRLMESGGKFEDTTGLFLKVLLEKLSDMCQLSPAINLLLTRLVCRLAHYPQPLLRSLLLNHQLVLKPGVPNLLSVLQSIKVKVDVFTRTQEGFEKRLGRARKTMLYWAKIRNKQVEETVGEQLVAEYRRLKRETSKASELGMGEGNPFLRTKSSRLSMEASEPPLRQQQQQQQQPVAKQREASLVAASQVGAPSASVKAPSSRPRGGGGAGSLKRKKKRVPTSTLFAVIIFHEFIKELAALSQEHSALHPLLYVPKSKFMCAE